MASTSAQDKSVNTKWDPAASTLDFKSLGHLIKCKLSGDHANKVIFIEASTTNEITGSQLEKKISNVACALLDLYNFKPGTAVGIGSPNSINKIIISLGVIFAGGFVTCLNDEFNEEEIFRLAHCIGPKLLICMEKDLDNWVSKLESQMGHAIVAISIDNESSEHTISKLLNYTASESRSLSSIPIELKNSPENIAFITTYKIDDRTGPADETVLRILPITHQACLAEQSLFANEHCDEYVPVAIQASLDSISGRWLTLRAMIEGYTGIVINGFKLPDYTDAIAKFRVGTVVLGINELNQLINFSNNNECDISSLRVISPASCKVAYWAVFNEFLKKNPQISHVYLGYGSSEILILTMKRSKVFDYLRNEDNCGAIPPHTEAKIINEQGQLCTKPRESGLLHIRGPTVLPGYYDIRNTSNGKHAKSNDPTKTPFIRRLPHPDGPTFDDEGFYITGDDGYIDENHELSIDASWRWFSWDI